MSSIDKSKRNKKIGLIISAICLAVAFISIGRTSGYITLIIPITVFIGLFFGGLSFEGKVKDGLYTAGFLFLLSLIVIGIAFLLRK